MPRYLVCNMALFTFCICMLAASVIPKDTSAKDPLSDAKHYKEGEHNEKYDHDAFLGQDEAEAFEELPPEEAKKKLGQLLPKIDKDSNGSITQDELKEHIKFMQQRYVNNDIERTWKTHKAENDKLGWKEYRESIYGPEPAKEKDLDPAYARMLERDEERWKIADKDGDKMLSLEEYGCFMHPESCEHMKDTVVKETIKDIDKNGDEMIDVEEYIADMFHPDDKESRDGEEPDWVKSEREMFTESRDKNNDGKLDMEEMRDWIMPSGFDHAEAEARHLISLADDNKDGVLTEKEIMAHHDAFVGSQVTDYGEQLRQHDPSEL